MLPLLLHISLLLLLGFVAWQDYKYRGISWMVFPLMLGIVVADVWFGSKWESIFIYWLANLSFVVLMLVGVTFYFSVKNKRLVNIADTYLGWGDILFFIFLALFFSPLNFMIFLIISLLFVLILVLVYKKIAQNIPLAGIQSTLLLLVLLSREFGLQIDPMDDLWFIQMLSKWN
jgi:hypothetical protein